MAVGTIIIHDSGPQGPAGPTGPAGTNRADIVLYFQYLLDGGEVLYEYVPSLAQMLLPANSIASVPAYSTSTYDQTINLLVNNTNIGTLSFAAGNTTGVFSFANTTLNAGDLFQLINQPAQDPSFGNVRVTIAGIR
jgi:hypothetical protein